MKSDAREPGITRSQTALQEVKAFAKGAKNINFPQELFSDVDLTEAVTDASTKGENFDPNAAFSEQARLIFSLARQRDLRYATAGRKMLLAHALNESIHRQIRVAVLMDQGGDV